MKLSELNDDQKVKLINNRWNSASSVWDELTKLYDTNLKIYQNEPEWLKKVPVKKSKVRANRIFRDMEAVINSLIANPPKPNFIPGRNTDESRFLATKQQQYFNNKYLVLDVKSEMRKGLRNLYLSRLIVLKPYWNAKTNDFDVRSINPKKIRVGKKASKEVESEFAIEEVTDSLATVLKRFPSKKDAILAKQSIKDDDSLLIENPEITYKEAWIKDRLMCSYEDILLDDVPNPYWDWNGVLITPEEEQQLQAAYGEPRREAFQQVRAAQSERKIQLENKDEGVTYQAYYFNHFDAPRKPYIFATILNNDESPIGQTDMITQAAPLQESIDRRKRQFDDNAKSVNGVTKVDASVMDKAEAEKLRYEEGDLIWGKGVATGVQRETGNALPQFIFDDMVDSRNEIDNIMAATSAFRGEREGQETKAGRLALIEQSQLMLNELTQVVDFVNYELFNWFYQLAKVRYTEYHYAKSFGPDEAIQILDLIQDDFEDGAEVRIIAGKTLPEDKQFQYQRAQEDVANGIISPVDYLEAAGYDDPKRIAKNSVTYKLNPIAAVGMSPEELQAVAPPPQPAQPQEEEKPKITIPYDSVPPEGQVQVLAQAGIQVNPETVAAHQEQKAQREHEHTIEQMKVKASLTPKNDERSKAS
jgi:hypothetical protein